MATDFDRDSVADQDPSQLLVEARVKASRLLERLISERSQIEESPSKLSAEALEKGRVAMNEAIAALRRTIQSLDDAGQASQ